MTRLKSFVFSVEMMLLLGVIGGYPMVAFADHQVFISDSAALRITDIATMGAVSDVAGVLGTTGGFDDGRQMVVDSVGKRIFVSNHAAKFLVFNFATTQLFPTWGVSLSESLGIAPLPTGKILLTDEEDTDGLFRLNTDLTLNAQTPDAVFNAGAEGVVYDSVNNRIFVADEDDEEIEIFNGTTLGHIATVGFTCSGDGPYWLGVDGSSGRVFALADGQCPGFVQATNNYGIHVFDLVSGANNLTFDQTLFGSGGGSSNCYGALAVSESTNRLFAIDYCNDTVAIYDTTNLNFLGTVPAARAGTKPLMVSVGDFSTATTTPIPTMNKWGLIILTLLAGFGVVYRLRRHKTEES